MHGQIYLELRWNIKTVSKWCSQWACGLFARAATISSPFLENVERQHINELREFQIVHYMNGAAKNCNHIHCHAQAVHRSFTYASLHDAYAFGTAQSIHATIMHTRNLYLQYNFGIHHNHFEKAKTKAKYRYCELVRCTFYVCKLVLCLPYNAYLKQ